MEDGVIVGLKSEWKRDETRRDKRCRETAKVEGDRVELGSGVVTLDTGHIARTLSTKSLCPYNNSKSACFSGACTAASARGSSGATMGASSLPPVQQQRHHR
jgi:hypothetical protein